MKVGLGFAAPHKSRGRQEPRVVQGDMLLFHSVTFLLLLGTTAKCDVVPDGVVHMECHDRYFMIAVNLSVAGGEPHFDAVDDTGVYPITSQYAAKCGYTLVPLPGHMELRASYFSCHTGNKDDELFTFNFNLVVTHDGTDVTYELNRTCSPSVPWSPREVTCEVNYMEVSVRSEVRCPSGTSKDDWNTLKAAHGSTTSDWQVMFHQTEEQLLPMNLSEARQHNYVFESTEGRLVFRTPYGQRDSTRTEVRGVPVETVHATLFSRRSWVVLMVDIEAACSMFEGSFDHRGYVVWKTPQELYPSLDTAKINVGLGGEVVPQQTATERGYTMEMHNDTVQIGIPYTSEGGLRKSVVTDGLYEFYAFDFYLEQVLEDQEGVETRLRSHRLLSSPLLPHPVFTENQTDPEERAFSVYLGDVPDDVDLVAVQINGHEVTIPTSDTSACTISKVFYANNTHGYSLTVPFDDPVVAHKFSSEDAVFQYELGLNFTLVVVPENASFHHITTVVASFTNISLPVFAAVCSPSGISFKLEHQPFHYLWEISIGPDPLTSDLAARRGYVMSNDSRGLQLDVPLFAYGYEYKNVSLMGFFASFEILVRDHETSAIQSSTVKTCPFNSTSEFIACSTDGRMIVVADLSLAVPVGGIAAKTSLRNKKCGPKDADDTMAVFSFPLNVCGSIIKIGKGNVTYQNEISYNKMYIGNTTVLTDATETVTVQCTYQLAGLHRLFSVFRFESDTVGVGRIIRAPRPKADLQAPVTTAAQTTPANSGTPRLLRAFPPAFPPHQYRRFSKFQHNMIQGVDG